MRNGKAKPSCPCPSPHGRVGRQTMPGMQSSRKAFSTAFSVTASRIVLGQALPEVPAEAPRAPPVAVLPDSGAGSASSTPLDPGRIRLRGFLQIGLRLDQNVEETCLLGTFDHDGGARLHLVGRDARGTSFSRVAVAFVSRSRATFTTLPLIRRMCLKGDCARLLDGGSRMRGGRCKRRLRIPDKCARADT